MKYIKKSSFQILNVLKFKKLMESLITILFVILFCRSSFSQSGDLYTMLSSLKFRNEGIVTKNTKFKYIVTPCYYMEGINQWHVDKKFEYLYELNEGKKIAPPTGMRSAVPLGGLGAGTLELRVDGSIKDWNIFNNSPAGGKKINLNNAFFAIRFASNDNKSYKNFILRTQPPESLSAIKQISYSGAFPVSKLRFSDPNLPFNLTLYAYCEYNIGNAKGSATPAVIFSFNLYNPTNKNFTTDLLFNLPNYIKGKLKKSKNGFTLIKKGKSPVSGGITVEFNSNSSNISYTSFKDVNELWNNFSFGDKFDKKLKTKGDVNECVVTSKFDLKPHSVKTITMVLAWDFPYRPYVSKVFKNFYATLYKNSEDVAGKVLSRLHKTISSIKTWQNICFENSLPHWFQDALINSVATMYKTSMWFADGRFRQWESFSCSTVEPIHIHFYRSLPYAWFFPDLQKQLLLTYAFHQKKNGYIQENLGGGCWSPDQLDAPEGRIMGDSNTDFILNVYQEYLWTGDRKFLNKLWNNVKSAINWEINRSKKFGLPDHLENTYDWYGYSNKDLAGYNAVLYLASLLATRKLAIIQNDDSISFECSKYIDLGRQALNRKLWNGKNILAWWMKNGNYPNAIQSDVLYGQLWSDILGLGNTISEHKIRSELKTELKRNGSPFGLKIMRGAGHNNETANDLKNKRVRDNVIWEAGTIDWAALNLYHGGSVSKSLKEAFKVIGKYQNYLKDEWNYRDISNGWNGEPYCNSHYTRQLIMWAILLAISGEHYNANTESLVFNPKVRAPAKLPFFTPEASGFLKINFNNTYKIVVLCGKLILEHLKIKDINLTKHFSVPPNGAISLSERKN